MTAAPTRTATPDSDVPRPTAPSVRSECDSGGSISVAVRYPGNRVEKLLVPLQATSLDVAVDPADAYERDIVVCDNADRDLGREVLRSPLHDAKLVYRMRGDVYRELELWGMHPVKKWAAHRVLTQLDGAIAVTPHLAEKLQARAGVECVGSAGLWKRVRDWPTVHHTGSTLSLLTLTNANYWRKIEAITDYAPVVDGWLAENGGHWHVCGDGEQENRLADALADYDHITYEGYVDAKTWLAAADAMFHPSYLDGQPNSILEGMASRLPVVTNDFEAFTRFAGPLYIVDGRHSLTAALDDLEAPSVRDRWGERGMQYIDKHHSPAAIGEQYVAYFRRLLDASNGGASP